mmetsp:Transcript_10338/g.18410  ORF Transcript_10338/g.18410 Transcript_10338/m.18410 type:complete len:122 (-) Transcript_10338:14-379(-)
MLRILLLLLLISRSTDAVRDSKATVGEHQATIREHGSKADEKDLVFGEFTFKWDSASEEWISDGCRMAQRMCTYAIRQKNGQYGMWLQTPESVIQEELLDMVNDVNEFGKPSEMSVWNINP